MICESIIWYNDFKKPLQNVKDEKIKQKYKGQAQNFHVNTKQNFLKKEKSK